jgi:serine/threonine-protein kinase
VSLPRIDEVILGKYQVLGQLGRGGMGVVYHAVNLTTHGHVALKFLSPFASDSVDPRENCERMWREARAVSSLRTRFIARMFDVERTNAGEPVLVMELVEGLDLGTELCRRDGRFEIDEAVAFIVQACAAVGEAHALGIVHRDLKPANLFIDRTGAHPMIRVIDFGLTKIIDPEASQQLQKLTACGVRIGTPSYMSPEQIRSSSKVDARTDVWALGVILHRALTGALPYTERGADLILKIVDPEPVPSIADHVGPGLAAVVARALAKEPNARYPNARALGEALRPFVVAPNAVTACALEELGVPAIRRPMSSHEIINHALPTPLEPISTVSLTSAPTRLRSLRTPLIQVGLGVASAVLSFMFLAWYPTAKAAAAAPPSPVVTETVPAEPPPVMPVVISTIAPEPEPTTPPPVAEAKRKAPKPRQRPLPMTALPEDRMPVEN